MKKIVVESLGKVAWALGFLALPAISLYSLDPATRECLIFGMLLFACYLILMKLNEILGAIKDKGTNL